MDCMVQAVPSFGRMSALSTLISDHRKVSELFEALQQYDEPPQRRVIFQQIKDELKAHTHLEETILYAQLLQFEELADFLESSYDEHREIKDIIEEIDEIELEAEDMDPVGVSELRDELESAVEELIDVVSYHVEQEEEKLFPQVLDLMTVPELERLEDALKSEVANRGSYSRRGQAA